MIGNENFLAKGRSWKVVRYLPWQRSIFALTEPVYSLFASRMTCPSNVKVGSFFPDPSKHDQHQSRDHKSPHCYYFHVNCWLLTILYPEMCVYSFAFYPIPEIHPLPLLCPASLIHIQWISCNPLSSSSLILMHKINGKSVFSRHFVNPLRFCFPAIVCLAQIHS